MHKRYLVTGKRKYRYHDPGSVFEAEIDPEAERRAIERGAIEVVCVVQPRVQDGSYTIPEDWLRRASEQGERVSSHS